jgi:deoxycytidylate deaminase
MTTDKQLRPDWTEYFLDIAKAVGRRATCLRRRYGAIIVKDKIIISTGYNGAPRGESNCIDTGICERQRLHVPKGQNYELCVSVHAEQNAIINADMAMIELVDFNELYNGGKKEVKKAKSRRGGKAKKVEEATEAPEASAEPTAEAAE